MHSGSSRRNLASVRAGAGWPVGEKQHSTSIIAACRQFLIQPGISGNAATYIPVIEVALVPGWQNNAANISRLEHENHEAHEVIM
jgi:hypothetical protein